jgi:hypothetical protein
VHVWTCSRTWCRPWLPTRQIARHGQAKMSLVTSPREGYDRNLVYSCFLTEQAGLSRATLEFSSESFPNFSLRTHKSHIFHWRSSFQDCLFFGYLPLSLSFKLKEDPISYIILMLSSFNVSFVLRILILVWSP